MKGIHTVARKDGTAVYISYNPPGRDRVREKVELVPDGPRCAARLREAQARARDVLIKRKNAIVERTFDLPRSRRAMTVEKFVRKLYGPELEHRGLRTAGNEIHRLTDGPVGRHFGAMQLTDLNEWKIRQFVKARREGGAGPATINRDLARLSNAWNFAKRRGLVIGDNPVSVQPRLREAKHRVRYLEPDEEARLLAELSPALRAIVEVALHTGIRRGALFGLRWRDVDFKAGMIFVPEDLSKSREPYPVGMNALVREVLRREHARLADHGPDALVFPKPSGQKRRSIRTSFNAACKRAGVESFRFHDLRHTTASRIVMAGGSLYQAANQLGHRTLEMTKRYAHLSPDHMKGVADLTLAPSDEKIRSRIGHAEIVSLEKRK